VHCLCTQGRQDGTRRSREVPIAAWQVAGGCERQCTFEGFENSRVKGLREQGCCSCTAALGSGLAMYDVTTSATGWTRAGDCTYALIDDTCDACDVQLCAPKQQHSHNTFTGRNYHTMCSMLLVAGTAWVQAAGQPARGMAACLEVLCSGECSDSQQCVLHGLDRFCCTCVEATYLQGLLRATCTACNAILAAGSGCRACVPCMLKPLLGGSSVSLGPTRAHRGTRSWLHTYCA
jgi:hypothetical protein